MSEDQCEWGIIDEDWDLTSRRWDDICPLVEVITRHGKASPEEIAREFEKLDKRKKRKLIRMILHLRGATLEQQREVRDDLHVSVEDATILLEGYEKYRKLKDISIKVENVEIK